MTTYTALSTVSCSPEKAPELFRVIVDQYNAANPEKTVVKIQHSICSIGSPMSPYIVLSVQFTATGE
jgi:hypothetical protein